MVLMALDPRDLRTEHFILATLIGEGIKKNGGIKEYEKAKKIIKEFYPEYYQKGIKIAAKYIGV